MLVFAWMKKLSQILSKVLNNSKLTTNVKKLEIMTINSSSEHWNESRVIMKENILKKLYHTDAHGNEVILKLD